MSGSDAGGVRIHAARASTRGGAAVEAIREGAQALHFAVPPVGLTATEYELHAVEAGLFALRAVSEALRLFLVDGALLPGYQPSVTDAQAASLGLTSSDDAAVYVVVNPADGEPTVNLLAPIVVNRRTSAAAQLVLESGEWPLRAPLSELLAA